MPTQRDVAHYAQVSSATVSRYITNPTSVHSSTAIRIQEAIEALGYQIDYSAQVLKTGRYNHIGILAPGIGPFYFEAFYGIQSYLNENGYFSTFFFTRDVDTLSHSYRNMVPPFMKKRQLDGIIFFPLMIREDDILLEQLSGWGKPFVVLDRPIPNPNLYQLYFDNYQGGRLVAQAFIEEGHTEFLFVWGSTDSSAAFDRFQGFKDRLAESGITLTTDRQIYGEFVAAPTYEMARAAIPRLPRFTAVFACNDSSAVGFMRAASEYGYTSPTDYSIVGYDDNIEFTPYLTPSLSTLRQPVREMCRQAARVLLDLIAGNEVPQKRQVFSPHFIKRESLGKPKQFIEG